MVIISWRVTRRSPSSSRTDLHPEDPCEILKDPLIEAVFGDMDQEDQTEFPEVREALMQRKLRKCMQPRKRKGPFATKAQAKKRARRVRAPGPGEAAEAPPMPPLAPPPAAPASPQVQPAPAAPVPPVAAAPLEAPAQPPAEPQPPVPPVVRHPNYFPPLVWQKRALPYMWAHRWTGGVSS